MTIFIYNPNPSLGYSFITFLYSSHAAVKTSASTIGKISNVSNLSVGTDARNFPSLVAMFELIASFISFKMKAR